MELDRRQFARTLGAGIAACTVPGWLAACARRDGGATEHVSESGLRRPDVAAAAKKGRAMLFLHVEDDAERSADLGRVVGSFLLQATDVEVAPLATVELSCATTAEILELAPDLVSWTGVRAVLVPLHSPPVCILDGDPPPVVWTHWGQEEAGLHEASIRERNAWFAKALQRGLGDDAASLERHADDERAAVGAAPEGATPSEKYTDTWPNRARLRASREPERREAWIAALAASARAKVKAVPPAGSVWATSGGCGVSYELPGGADPSAGIACGMGHVPEISRRFLHFYTAEERNG
jgi:hypothetical protein